MNWKTEQPGMIFFCHEPQQWPIPHETLSYTTLREIEKCPRCWALSHAAYPDIWEKNGYPQIPSVPAVFGTIVHRAVESITRELIETGCESTEDPCLVQILRSHGGWSKILMSLVDEVLPEKNHNPRLDKRYGILRAKTSSQVPKMRETAQNILRRIDLGCSQKRNSGKTKSKALKFGSYSEVYLESSDIQFHGRIDLIKITEDGCVIIDFKTGHRCTEHELQVQIYALLWWLDTNHNPTRKRATKLGLSYKNGDVWLEGPSEDKLRHLKSKLIERASQARMSLTCEPPEIKPALETCSFCLVRHLCNEYWAGTNQQNHRANGQTFEFVDIEARIERRHGPRSWDAKVNVAPGLQHDETILVRMDAHHEVLEYCYATNQKIRMLNCHPADAVMNNEEGPKVIYLNNASEVFIVPNQNNQG
jgi:hypothetical protein